MTKIDPQKVVRLFNERAGLYGKIPTLNISIFQEKHGDLAQRRDQIERDIVMSIIGDQIKPNWYILDAGCGTGRWAHFLAPEVKGVIAFDASIGLIEICGAEAEKLGIENVVYYQETLSKFSHLLRRPLITPDLIVISGVILYTDDDQWGDIMGEIKLASRTQYGNSPSLIVVRETCGSHGRYELHDVWSEELQMEYSAIYRDPDWFRGGFGTFCETIYDAPLLPPELEKWPETNQHLFIFRVIR